MIAELRTAAGVVGRIEIPECKSDPDIVQWGVRFFRFDASTIVEADGQWVPVYQEAFCWVHLGPLLPEETPAGAVAPSPAPVSTKIPRVDYAARESTSGRITDSDGAAPDPELDASGQHQGYWVLSAAERAKGFQRPVRTIYRHLACGTDTRMGNALAETYARDPTFYASTFCSACRNHLPVGADGEFVWVDQAGNVTQERVGT